ncbi:alpha/beta fold hydrolase [Sphaerisporangium aureirubrum]|uniref:Alpha/beta fold hydrolase n=1 Tax=Sphaerisporangium aureirubrum TaxID=1544736 RepID=A0ABW1NGG6_9ACTN
MKSQYILVPGAWMGAWVWEPVIRGLQGLGHQARAVTLSGLTGPDADVSGVRLSTHVDDVISLLEKDDLRDVILVAHSYSGIVAGQVADRVPDRVAHTVFVEAFLPHDGLSMLHAFPERQRAAELRLIAENDGRWPVPDVAAVAEGQDLSPRQAEWLVEHFVGHPGHTLSEPAVLTRPLSRQRATYVVCTKDHYGGRVSRDVTALRHSPTWRFHTLDTGHWPMTSAPAELVSLLAGVAAR